MTRQAGGLLLDTNVVSELRKQSRAHPAVSAWFLEQADDTLFLSIATFGEIRMGIERLRARDPGQAAGLANWADTLKKEYRSRLLEITLEIFERWGHLQGIRPLPAMDALLAATALHHDLTLVTRNIGDFHGLGLRVFNPFTGEHSSRMDDKG